MQVVHQDTRRQSNPQQQQIVVLQTENNNDIDGTTNRVASVTLESDSLSADQPMSFRSKRRKKIPRKEKMTEMDLDGKDKMKSSSVEDDNNNVTLPKGNKTRMDWEMTETIPSSSLMSSDVATNYSDVFSDFSDESTSDADADDEQSDWPDSCKPPFRSSTNQHGVGHHLLHPDINSTGGDAVLSGQVLKEVQEFLKDSSKKELFLDKVYRTSAIKQILRQEAVQVQIVKKGRGTVALKKI
uniref:PiggyBac transposable element-derived protein domain-containing protein n=1 Tax=Meloidogyne floridensis TaxID=298350 RepID=A0A915NKY9_9BILA